MINLKGLTDLKNKASSIGMSELSLYLIKLMTDMRDELEDLIHVRTRQIMIECKQHTTVGGNVTEEIAVNKASADRKLFVSIVESGASPVSIISSKCEDGKIMITFSADPGNDHKISYLLID